MSRHPGTTATGPSTEANGSDAVTPLRRPKRNLKKNKEAAKAVKRSREDDHPPDSKTSSLKRIDTGEEGKSLPAFPPNAHPAYLDHRLRGGAGPSPVTGIDQTRQDKPPLYLVRWTSLPRS